VRGNPGQLTNLGDSTVVSRSTGEVRRRVPTVRCSVVDPLYRGDAGADVVRVEMEGPAIAASQMISSHQRSSRTD
jgi:hypothetical protein